MRARAVIGANFGDEGKGLVTDWLCRDGADYVVRFNGGAQAGHTIVMEDGRRHVFHHFGAGTFHGIPTYLSKFFICNPLLYFREKDELATKCSLPGVFGHPECLITTFADMIINQELETKRGVTRHGSVGVGINETVERSGLPELRITLADLWNRSRLLESKLVEICGKYSEFRTGKKIDNPERMIAAFMQACEEFANEVNPMGMASCKGPLFEGAQGLLLDQNNKDQFPHVTRSNTGIKNVLILCREAGIGEVDAYYVSRTYLTRHGSGKLTGEDARLSYHDDTNVSHPFQGKLRFAPLDYNNLVKRIQKDYSFAKLVLTHVDQCSPTENVADWYVDGPSADAVHRAAVSSLKRRNHDLL